MNEVLNEDGSLLASKRPSTMISVRLSAEEAEVVRKAAAASDQSVSEYVRRAALQPSAPAAGRASILFDLNRPVVTAAAGGHAALSGTGTLGGFSLHGVSSTS
jgi:hypothetical protein